MGARVFLVSVGLCLFSHAAAAQIPLPSAPLQSGLPSAPLQMTLPTASLPATTPIPPPRPDLFLAGPDTYAPRFDRLLPPPPFFPCCGGFGPFFGPSPPWWSSRSGLRQTPQAQPLGHLRLLVQPGTTHVYVNGFYMGTVDDVRQLVSLEPASYRVELRATGYESVTFDVNIVANDTITYRTDLQSLSPAEKPVAPPPGVPKTFYVIPNCYAGDKPPTSVTLPKTCDTTKVRTIPPTVNAIRPTPPAR